MKPEGDAVRQALAWIAERRRLEPERKLGELIDEAGRRYDLSPLEQEALVTWLTRPQDGG